MHASSHGQVEVVDTLLQHGARVDFEDNVRVYIRIGSHIACLLDHLHNGLFTLWMIKYSFPFDLWRNSTEYILIPRLSSLAYTCVRIFSCLIFY